MTMLDELPTRAFGAATEERPAGVLVPERGTMFAGRYRVEGVVGFGGMGIVLAARDERSSERVAIKLLLPPHSEHKETRERFAREAAAGRALTSEHACRVLDAVDPTNEAAFIVMEHLVGDTLAAVLRERSPLGVPESVDLALQACDALANAHACGIVHRDIKPGNLVITRHRDGSPCLKVIDFGVSKHTLRENEHSPTRTYAYVGSPVFSAPEQLDAARQATAASDQWSIAVVLYRCLTGHLPFDFGEGDVWAVREIVKKRAPVPPRDWLPSLPAGLELALLRALSRRPEDRFASIADFARAIAPFGDPLTLAKLPHILLAPRPIPDDRANTEPETIRDDRALDTGTVSDDDASPSPPSRAPASTAVAAPVGAPVVAEAPARAPSRAGRIALASLGIAATIALSVSVTALVIARPDRTAVAPSPAPLTPPVGSEAMPDYEVLEAPSAVPSGSAAAPGAPKPRSHRRVDGPTPRFLKTRSGQ